ncbi:hypothetical protein SAPIO_CDS3176 [Scedosporium apiospermum]|uniref:Velvet domain-containing protein n=1 Tax=Pseudallescheria apiosperma TaxID=563466 RepID=A0A084GA72_PSEDA|nr:uncharacterized protein SAPIO_CDS3176 [Scedosporium apiospermum]KEZ44234.1 hypothetical protein SAPIO_CDS3176 [Scedosporium apiospermum]
MDPTRYPPIMHPQMGDTSAAYSQVMQHPQMSQQPPHMPMQMPPAPQQVAQQQLPPQLPHQVNHGHVAQQQYPTPLSQYPSSENMQSNGNQVAAAPASSIIPSPRLPPGQSLLQSISKVDEATGRKYTLVVEQQPKRARMCGFGDKDRRPITPPPCVRLIVTDLSGKEVDVNSIDHGMFVLNVDLWNEDGSREVNLVRHSSGTPSISSTTPASYGSLTSSTPAFANILPSHRDSSYPPSDMSAYGQPIMSQYGIPPGYGQAPSPYGQGPQPGYPQSPYMPPNAYSPATQYYPQGDFRSNMGPVPQLPSNTAMGHYGATSPGYGDLSRMGHNQPQGMFTRNLIGSLAASAFRLIDSNDKIGIWFVLQDLSVRTEGHFRLRFSFVNVGPPPNANGNGEGPVVNTGKSPVLASCFSDVFTVFSAKKFPGVCESTPLSKCFAHQGIKIPIRKEANSRGGDDDDDY